MAQSSTLESISNKLDLDNSQPPREGHLTQVIESQTSKIPSVTYLNLAIGSMVISAGLAIFADRKAWANFVGLWAPSFMLMGIYNKLVKLEGSDAYSSPNRRNA